MKKIILILITILFATNVFAHSTKGHTPNLDSKRECTKKKSMLNFISKHRLFKGKGEIIKFNSYTGFDIRTVITVLMSKPVYELNLIISPLPLKSLCFEIKFSIDFFLVHSLLLSRLGV